MIDNPSPEHDPLPPTAETPRNDEDNHEEEEEEERRREADRIQAEEALAEAQQATAAKDAEDIATAEENLENTYSSSAGRSSSGMEGTRQGVSYNHKTLEVSPPESLPEALRDAAKNVAKDTWEATKAIMGKLFG